MLIQKAAAIITAAVAAATGFAQLRFANWNITFYDHGRIPEFQTAIYGIFEGRQFAPDVLVCQELLSSNGRDIFLFVLNTAPFSPGDWDASPFINGNDTESLIFYRTSKVHFLGTTVVSEGSGDADNQPRNIYRYDFQPIGYNDQSSTIYCYSTHMKSGSTSTDKNRRLIEAQKIREDAALLPPGSHFVVSGDFNIPASSEAAYQRLVGASFGGGRVQDPVFSAGTWRNNASFTFLHTQDPAGGGGMDDRFDQILVSNSLINNDGMDYIGDATTAFSVNTWNDSNHSFRVWGNDGTSFNQQLTIFGNTMVGQEIAQALVGAALNTGHLPVYLDFRVPPVLDCETVVDFGNLVQGSTANRTIHVSNEGNVNLWTANGIAPLNYSIQPQAPFSAPTDSFTAYAGDSPSEQIISLDTSKPGVYRGTLTITSNAPDQPTWLVHCRARIVGERRPR